MSTLTSTGTYTHCESCGFEVSGEAKTCPNCGQVLQPASVRLPLIVIVFLIFAVFAFTQYFVRLHRGTEADLAQRWFDRGNEAMRANNPAAAADDFRTALSYDRDDPEYRLRLAEALLESNHLNEARAHLSSLWEEEPADGEVNLDLARLYARLKMPTEAVRYYRNAINGVWKDNPVEQREAARFELVHYLMQRNDRSQATAELMALQADEPRDVPNQLRLADLLTKLGDSKRAVPVYQEILKVDHANVPALMGLGEALLNVRDYRQAERAFAAAAEYSESSVDARRQLELSREILRISPDLRGLSFAERARRVSAAFNAAWARLMSCAGQHGYNPSGATATKSDGGNTNASSANSGPPAPQTPALIPRDFEVLYRSGSQMASEASERWLRTNPDSLEPVMRYVFQVERETEPLCSDISSTDRALLQLAQHENEISR